MSTPTPTIASSSASGSATSNGINVSPTGGTPTHTPTHTPTGGTPTGGTPTHTPTGGTPTGGTPTHTPNPNPEPLRPAGLAPDPAASGRPALGQAGRAEIPDLALRRLRTSGRSG